MERKNRATEFSSFICKAFTSLGFLVFVFFPNLSKAEISENWKIFRDPDLIGIAGCYASTEVSIHYYYNNILHYVFLLKYEDGFFPVAIINFYHPSGELAEPDLKYDPSLEALEFMEIYGHVSSPNGMWGLYIIDFLERQSFADLGKNRSPDQIMGQAHQTPCPKEVPAEFYREIFKEPEKK